MLAAAAAGCDQGHQADQPTTLGPSVHVVGTNVDASHKATTNGVIQIAFDRMLLPLSVNRQSFILLDYTKTPIAPIVTYDPVARVVTLSNPDPSNPAWLKADQAYKVVLGIPDGNADVGGVRAVDRATLDPQQPLEIGFLVSAETTPNVASLVNGAGVSFCGDILPIFSGSCAQSTCHGAVTGKIRPAAGLVLTTSAGVANTAIGRVANGSNTGPLAGPGHTPSHKFGIDMPIVDPGAPGNSWLLYKVLLAVPGAPPPPVDLGDAGIDGGTGPGTNGCAATDPGTRGAMATGVTPLSDDERDRLSNYVLGNRMPYPTTPGRESGEGLTLEQLERLRAWIQQGAVVTDCAACAQ